MRLVAPALAVLALVFLAAPAVAGPAVAGDEVLRLTWSAPAGCPKAEEVRSATLREAAAQPANGGDVLEAEASVEQKDPTTAGEPGWRVRLRTRRGTATGEREIEASTCKGVVEATVVVLALALVPPAAADDEAVLVAPPPAATARDERDAPAPARRTGEERHALAIGAAVAGDASTLPAATPGGSLTLAWSPGRLRLELDARRWSSQSQSLASSVSGARFAMTSLGARACWTTLRAGDFELAPCAGADVHLVSADGYGADANYSASAEWTTVTGGALGRFALASWLSLRARAEAFVPLSRPTFVVQNEGPVHRPPSIGAAATLGVEVLFL